MRHAVRSPLSASASRFVRTVVLWLIAAVLPFDGAALAAQTAGGSWHVHVQHAPQTLRLVDLRRTDAAPTLPHEHTGAQRHRHAFGDASVVPVGDASSDGDGMLAASTLMAALGGLPTASTVPAPTARTGGGVPSASAWTPSCGPSERLERPPRS